MHRVPLRFALAALALLAQGAGLEAKAAATSTTIEATEAPEGFDALARPRDLVADIYFAGTKVGEAIVVAHPGFLSFKDPEKVVSLLPNLVDPASLVSALR